MNKRERTRIEHVRRIQTRKRIKEVKKKAARADLTEEERLMYGIMIRRIEEDLKKNLESGK